MNEPVNIVNLVQRLPRRPRGRACFVLTHDYQGQSEWVKKLTLQTDSDHIDLLDLFAKDENIAEKIGEFSLSELFPFLEKCSKALVLIVTGLEFLKATWTAQPNIMDQFANMVETWNRKPCLFFVLQYDKALAVHEFSRFRQYTFIVDQKDTLAL